MVKLKNVYEAPSNDDGQRVLIQRLWPSEVNIYLAKIHVWMKELAPSYDLLEELREDPKEWKNFEGQYLKEFEEASKRVLMLKLYYDSRKADLTLLYGQGELNRKIVEMVARIIEKGNAGKIQ